MDTTIFFQEATLRICSSLELNKALCALLNYIKDFLPVQNITCILIDEENATLSVVASTDATQEVLNKYSDIKYKTIIPVSAKQMWVSYANTIQELKQISYIETNMAPEPLSDDTLWYLPIALLRMVIEDKPSGALLFHGITDKKFTKTHMELLKQLHAPCALAVNNCLRFQEALKLKQQLRSENIELQARMDALTQIEVIGAKTGLRHVMNLVRHVAPLHTPVFIQGESGVGKEVIAHAIHELSSRKDMPFVVVNCGALNTQLLESEFFGHEKGAFTNAIRSHKGFFERAQKGTIFLDEICELPLESQTKLLRVLQSYEVQRVGGNKPIPIDVRIISASNKNLKEAMQSGELREDLYYRLSVFPIIVPPLRERISDIPALVGYFLQKKAAKMHRKIPMISNEVMTKLVNYSWQGNVRELENFIERALVLSPADKLLIYEEGNISQNVSNTIDKQGVRFATLKEMTEEHLRNVLKYTQGRICGKDGAAAILGLNRFVLYRKLDELNIPYGRKAKF